MVVLLVRSELLSRKLDVFFPVRISLKPKPVFLNSDALDRDIQQITGCKIMTPPLLMKVWLLLNKWFLCTAFPVFTVMCWNRRWRSRQMVASLQAQWPSSWTCLSRLSLPWTSTRQRAGWLSLCARGMTWTTSTWRRYSSLGLIRIGSGEIFKSVKTLQQ